METKTKNAQYVIFGLLIMLLLGSIYSYSVFRPTIETTFQVNSFLSGLPFMFVLFFYSLMMMIGGFLLDKYDTKKVAYSAVFLIVVGYLLASKASTIWMLTVSYGVLLGSGIGLLYGIPLRTVMVLPLTKKGLATGTVLMGFGLSSLAFAPIIEYALEHIGLSSTFLWFGVIYAIVLTVLIFFLTRGVKDPVRNIKFNVSIIKEKQFIGLYILYVIATLIGLTMIGYTALWGIDVVLLSAQTAALIVGLLALFNGAGRPLFGYFADTIGIKKTAMISFVTLILGGVSLIFIGTTLFGFILGFAIIYMNFGGWLSLAPSATRTYFGDENYSRNYGMVFTAYGVGALIGISAGGNIVDRFGFERLPYMIVLLAILGFITVITSFKK
jgi:predicted MFS family arabinose efflux permease